MTNVAAIKTRNAQRWHNMHVRASLIPQFRATAARLCTADTKARFQGVSDRLAEMIAEGARLQVVPWWFVAIVSEREYGPDQHGNTRWDCQLGQGDRLDRVSHNEPAGRGPFLDHTGDVTPGHDAWTRCALDALIDCAPHAAAWSDWSIGGALTLFEEYNGLGYAARGIASPYVWAGSDQYVAGKFVADHVFNPRRVDVQEGCAPLLSMMMALDASIRFTEIAA